MHVGVPAMDVLKVDITSVRRLSSHRWIPWMRCRPSCWSASCTHCRTAHGAHGPLWLSSLQHWSPLQGCCSRRWSVRRRRVTISGKEFGNCTDILQFPTVHTITIQYNYIQCGNCFICLMGVKLTSSWPCGKMCPLRLVGSGLDPLPVIPSMPPHGIQY